MSFIELIFFWLMTFSPAQPASSQAGAEATPQSSQKIVVTSSPRRISNGF